MKYGSHERMAWLCVIWIKRKTRTKRINKEEIKRKKLWHRIATGMIMKRVENLILMCTCVVCRDVRIYSYD